MLGEHMSQPDHDFTAALEFPRPHVTADAARECAAIRYGLRGEVKELGSQQDRNFRFTAATGRYLLKFANPSFSYAELEAQNLAMQQLALHGIAAPAPIASLNSQFLEGSGTGDDPYVRLATFVEGEPLTECGYLSDLTIAEMGRLAAATDLALHDLDHPGLDRDLQWDMRNASAVVHQLSGYIGNEAQRERVLAATRHAWATIDELAPSLRRQPIHADLTDDNVVCSRGEDGRLHPFGVIDLGDVTRSWLVAEIAVTCSSILHHNRHHPLSITHAVAAYNSMLELTNNEIRAIWPLIIARGAVLAVSGEYQVAVDPQNDYARNNLAHEWLVFDIATEMPSAVATRALLDALGRPGVPVEEGTGSVNQASEEPSAVPEPILPMCTTFGIVDLSPTSSTHDDGAWLDPNIEDRAFREAKRRDGVAIARYGEYRLSRSGVLSTSEPATYSLGVEIAAPQGCPIVAPLSATVSDVGRYSVSLSTAVGDIRIEGFKPSVTAGTDLQPGDVIGTTPRGQHKRLWVQLCTDSGIQAPRFVPPSQATAWRDVCPDPSPLFGFDCAAPPTRDHDWLARRSQVLSVVSHHYYREPPRIERGWGSFLIDSHARSYLDMCNNVSSVGHSHPRIAEAAHRQWRLLNTNSRFHYATITEYAERLTALMPPGLDTVLLVNSGTEAVDLAIRVAQIYTGRETLVALDESYHGWSKAADAVSASTADNPIAATTRPYWTRFLATPNSYRGDYRGPDSVHGYLGAAHEAVALWAAQAPIAGFIAEPVFGNGGGILLPDGYLAGIYSLIRSYGGLCIADEVQVGGGRLGHYFWGFEQQGVVPDIITIAKPFGNGQPLGAVITRREIADRLAGQGALFSSAGGSPVSARIGIEILDIIRDERLQANAAGVGDYLKQRLLDLAMTHPLVGHVHGMGLYLGLELVDDHESLTPAAAKTAAICDRLRELGIIDQPAGDRFNVLKIKPPLCLTKEAADFYVDTLAGVLDNGW